MRTHLSPHFTLEEFVASETATRLEIPNAPDSKAVRNLRRLAFTLEEVRAVLNCAVVISSGYRCSALNAQVSVCKTSAHIDGRAADFRPVVGTVADAFARIQASPIAYDQLIIERTRKGAEWIHLGIAREGVMPRRQALAANDASGTMVYRIAAG